MYNEKQVKKIFLKEVKDSIVKEPKYNELIDAEISKLYDLSIKSIAGLDEEDTELLRDRFGIIEERIKNNVTLKEKYLMSRKGIDSRISHILRKMNDCLKKEFFNNSTMPELLDLKLEYLDFPGDICALLYIAELNKVRDLLTNDRQDLLNIVPEISMKDIKQINGVLTALGLRLGDAPIFSQKEIDSLSLEEKKEQLLKSLRIPHFEYLYSKKIKKVGELTELTSQELLSIPYIGKEKALEIRKALNNYGLDIKDAKLLEKEIQKEQIVKRRTKIILNLRPLINGNEKSVVNDKETKEILFELEKPEDTILNLTALETNVIRKSIGFDNNKKAFDFPAIAQELEISTQKVEKSFNSGIAKIKKYVEKKRNSKKIAELEKEKLKLLNKLKENEKERKKLIAANRGKAITRTRKINNPQK